MSNMDKITWDRIGDLSLENSRRNLQYLHYGKSLADLPSQPIGEKDTALIVASGPSIKIQDPAPMVSSSGYKGAIICTESAIRYLLIHSILPDLVVTVDPHPHRIVRWLGDPTLTEEKLDKDDYFRRQDMDTSFAQEMTTNTDPPLRLRAGFPRPGAKRFRHKPEPGGRARWQWKPAGPGHTEHGGERLPLLPLD